VNTRPLLLLLLVSACAPQPRVHGPATASAQAGGFGIDMHVPDFARRPFEPFSRENTIAIAQREWRAFGMNVNDDPPDQQDRPRDLRPDHQPGLWQRVGEYWWLGQNAGNPEEGWTSKYSENGTRYAGDAPAWSAAFISYVMRSAGAGDRFAYSATHAAYINGAVRGEESILQAERTDTYAPQPGDLICLGRGTASNIRFESLPAPGFPGHCDLVTEVAPGQLTVIGGNVDASVTVKHVPIGTTGLLSEPGGRPYDSRYDWFVVLHVLYDAVS